MNIIGLGNALMDVLLRLENDSVLQELGLPKGVMEMIDEEQMRATRKAQRHLERSEAPGGSVCNTMRAIALLGTPTGFIGKIGSDPVGRNYEQKLLESGVTPYFLHSEGISGSCTVLISPDGERTMGTFLGPAPDISPEEITDEMLRPYHCIYIEGYLLVNAALVKGVMQQAKRLGMKIALDLSNFNIVNTFRELLDEIIPEYVDILFSNESEANAYTGLQAEDAVKALSEKVEISLVTIGKNGILVGSKGEYFHIPAEGGSPVDTTGAGDHFAAGFLYGLSRNVSLKQSAQIGSLLAGYIISVVGAQIPDKYWQQIKLKVNTILTEKD